MFKHSKNHYCVFSKKIEDCLFNAVGEIERNFKNLKKEIKEDIFFNFFQVFAIDSTLPKQDKMVQTENVFLFDLETYNGKQYAQTYPAGSYNANQLRANRIRALTPEKKPTEKENVIVFDQVNENLVMKMLKFVSENSDGNERI